MICFYHNDLDGRCSAAIVAGWVGLKDCRRAEFVEMDYARPIPWDKIQPGEQVWIVDFSFKPDDMKRLLAITTDVTWIDHHATAIDKLHDLSAQLAGLRNPDEAACCLTWKYVHWYSRRGSDNICEANEKETGFVPQPHGIDRLIPIPRCVAMIGDYDAWLHKIPDSTAFYEGCKMLPFQADPSSLGWFDLLCGEAEGVYGDGRPLPKRDVCSPIIERGKAAILYRDTYCKEMCDSYGWESEIDGVKCWVTNIYKFGSMGFGERMKQYPICVACVFSGGKWTVSLYSDRPEINVGLICQKFGGGGHKGAAGFVSLTLPV